MAIISYQMKGTLMDAPVWWQRFVHELDDENPNCKDISVILRRRLKDEYCATLERTRINLYILRFENDESHLMFMLRYA